MKANELEIILSVDWFPYTHIHVLKYTMLVLYIY